MQYHRNIRPSKWFRKNTGIHKNYFRTLGYLCTNYDNFTFAFMIYVFDVLQDFQGLSPFLNAGISTIELENLGCCV
jgi:hypothetical protein